jgi:hypothetical protein
MQFMDATKSLEARQVVMRELPVGTITLQVGHSPDATRTEIEELFAFRWTQLCNYDKIFITLQTSSMVTVGVVTSMHGY